MLNTMQTRELAACNRHHHSKFSVCLVGFVHHNILYQYMHVNLDKLSASCWQPMNEASCKYELVDVIRACLGIYGLRVRSSWGMSLPHR